MQAAGETLQRPRHARALTMVDCSSRNPIMDVGRKLTDRQDLVDIHERGVGFEFSPFGRKLPSGVLEGGPLDTGARPVIVATA